MYTVQRLAVFSSISLFAFFGGAVAARAAGPELHFRTSGASLTPGSEFTVAAFVSTTEPTNAYDVEIGYSAQTLELVDVSIADSVIDIWRGGPETLEVGIVRVRGGSLRPFSGRAGELVKLDFRVRPAVSGTLQWSFRRTDLYAADGKGTLRSASWEPLVLPIQMEGVPARIARETDTAPPTFISVSAVENPLDDSWFAIWLARDEVTGVRSAHLRLRRWFFWEPWQHAVNPVRLPSGVWMFEVRVTDGAGNSAYQTVVLTRALATRAAGSILAAAVLLSVALWFRARRRRGSGVI